MALTFREALNSVEQGGQAWRAAWHRAPGQRAGRRLCLAEPGRDAHPGEIGYPSVILDCQIGKLPEVWQPTQADISANDWSATRSET